MKVDPSVVITQPQAVEILLQATKNQDRGLVSNYIHARLIVADLRDLLCVCVCVCVCVLCVCVCVYMYTSRVSNGTHLLNLLYCKRFARQFVYLGKKHAAYASIL
jgi:hypothetical protein